MVKTIIIFLIFLNLVQYNDCKCFIKDTIDYKLEPNKTLIIDCFGSGHYFDMLVRNNSRINLVFMGLNNDDIVYTDNYYGYVHYNLGRPGVGAQAKIFMTNENEHDVYISFSFKQRQKEDIKEESNLAFIFVISGIILSVLLLICLFIYLGLCNPPKSRDGYDDISD